MARAIFSGLAGSALVALALPAKAQTIDPALAASWKFVQEQMPGVPYSLVKAACDEGALMLYHGTWSDAQKAQVAQFKARFPCIKNLQMFDFNAGPLRQRFLGYRGRACASPTSSRIPIRARSTTRRLRACISITPSATMPPMPTA